MLHSFHYKQWNPLDWKFRVARTECCLLPAETVSNSVLWHTDTESTRGLTFRHRASSIKDRHFATLQRTLFIYLINKYTGCNSRNVRDFGRVFLRSNYTAITQNTYIQSWTVTEIMAGEVWNFDSCYSLIDYQIHIETGRNRWFL